MSHILDQKIAQMSPQAQRLWKLRHTAEHLLHTAMQNLYPKLLKAMGPATDEGFYFDFDLDQKISEADFPQIEAEMRKLAATNAQMVLEEISPAQARKIFAHNPYKLDWVEQITSRGEKVTVYKMVADDGKTLDLDLCSGPHVERVGEAKVFKLLSVAGAYWHGDEKNKMLTRIYGVAFPTPKELDDYLNFLEEAKRRDHRKLGRDLDLFTFSPLVGSGLPLYTPKGALLRHLVNQYVEEVQSAQDYHQVWTPQIVKAELFQTSGHYDKYKGDMFKVFSNHSEEEFYLKPMNCPQHTQIYASRPRSYRDLPLRYTDFAMLYRDEKPGELNGLARVRSFSQDDCHIFCREDQVDKEIDTTLSMIKHIMTTYGFKYRYRLSTRDPQHPEKYLGDPKIWDKVEDWSEKIMQRNNIDYFPAPGEAAFYAPKMDLMATDAIGREWQLSTVQIDYVMPARFNLTYTDKDGQPKQPIMIHRAVIGSSERFLMILLEHYGGAFPVWLAPVQAAVLPITDKQQDYAAKVVEGLRSHGIRAEINDKNEPLSARIRDAQLQKIPYMLIAGAKEAQSETVAVRTRDGQDHGQQNLADLIAQMKKRIVSRDNS